MLSQGLVMVIITAMSPLPALAQGPPDLASAVDRYVQPLLNLDVFSGVILVARGDSVLIERAYGLADVENRVPLTTEHVFRIASVSKSFTLALAGRLAVRGVIELDAPIDRWLPEFPSAGVITPRMLLHHRAGVPHVNSLPYDEEALRPPTLVDLVDSIARLPLDFEPGTDRRYSNGGYAVATRILEIAAGRPYSKLLRDEILDPLELGRTREEGDGDLVVPLARGYELDPEAFGELRTARYQVMATKTGGGSLVSNAGDLHRWVLAIGRHHILDTSTWDSLFGAGDQWASTGRSPGYNTAVVRDGETVAVVLANTYAAGMTYELAQGLIALSRGRVPVPIPVADRVVLDENLAKAVQGAYRLPPDFPPLPGGTFELRRAGDDLVVYLEGAPIDVAVPQGGRSFLLRTFWSKMIVDPPVAGEFPGLVVEPLYTEGSYRVVRLSGGES